MKTVSRAEEIAMGIETAALWSDGQPMAPAHDCVWDRIRRDVKPEPIGAPFCSVCDDWSESMELGGLEDHTLDDESRAKLITLAGQWLDAIGEDAELYADQREYDASQGTVWEYMGHDLYLSAARHGTGLWDRNLGALGDRLDEITKREPFSSLEHASFYATSADGATIDGLTS